MWRWLVSAVLIACGGTKLVPITDSDSVDTAPESTTGGDTDTTGDSDSDSDSDSASDSASASDTGALDTSGGSTIVPGPCDYVSGPGGLLSTEVSFMQEVEADGRIRWIDRSNTAYVTRHATEPGNYTVYFSVPYADSSYTPSIDTLAASFSEIERTAFLYRFQLLDDGGLPADAEGTLRIMGDAVAADDEYMMAQAFFASTFGASEPETLRCLTTTRLGVGQYRFDFDGEPLEPRFLDIWTRESNLRILANESTGLSIEIRDASKIPVDADMFLHVSSAR